jgi:hypothetical protein
MAHRGNVEVRMAMAFAVALGVAACSRGDSEPEAPDPVVILAASADRMESVGSFAFGLEHENGTTALPNGLQMVSATGEMSGTERMRAQVQALAGPLTANVEIVVLPEGSWMTNPLTRQWGTTTLSVSQFFDPANGVPALMRGIPEATLVGTEAVDGVPVHLVEADVATELLVGLVPDAAPGRTIHVRFWIGPDDPVLHRLEIRGPVKDGEAPAIVRRLTFSEFGASFTIQRPV